MRDGEAPIQDVERCGYLSSMQVHDGWTEGTREGTKGLRAEDEDGG